MENKIKEMEVILEKMNRLFHSIKINAAHINKIELDLMKDYVKQFYELTLEHQLGREVDVTIQDRILEPTQDLKKDEILPVINEINFQEKSIEDKKPEKQDSDQKRIENIPNKKITDKKPLAIIHETEDDDEFNTGLNNKLQKDKKTISDKIKLNNPVDLMKVIDLNDKLFLIRELFKGDHNLYDQTMRTLNQQTNMQNAQQFIQNELCKEFGWKTESAGVERLFDILKEKFL